MTLSWVKLGARRHGINSKFAFVPCMTKGALPLKHLTASGLLREYYAEELIRHGGIGYSKMSIGFASIIQNGCNKDISQPCPDVCLFIQDIAREELHYQVF